MTGQRRRGSTRRSVVVLAGRDRVSERPARALAASLSQLGVATTYLGREDSAQRIAAVVSDQKADAVELCLGGGGGIQLLRDLLRELTDAGRRDASIVVHRID